LENPISAYRVGRPSFSEGHDDGGENEAKAEDYRTDDHRGIHSAPESNFSVRATAKYPLQEW
jgi:hypothetical protein